MPTRRIRSKRPNVEKGDATPPIKASSKAGSGQQTSKKYRPKVAEESGKSRSRPKGIVIKEPVQTRSKSSAPDTTSKQKTQVQSSSGDSSTDSDSLDRTIRNVVQGALKDIGVGPSKASNAQSQKSVPQTSRTLIEEEIAGPPSDFNTKTLLTPDEKKRYEDLFSSRPMCPVVSVDLPYLRDNLGFNLYGYLEHYRRWLQIDLPYSPSVVRVFYCNLFSVNLKGNKKEASEERLETTVRGQKVQLSPSIINSFLGYDEHEFDETPQYTEEQIFHIIKPVTKAKKFSSMCLSDDQRLLWYIYTRAFVNKYQNFNHFSSRDFNNLAALVSGIKMNVGEFIYQELCRYTLTSNKTTPAPFPQLVSLFLKMNNIWYLDDSQARVDQFGKTQIKKMRIALPSNLHEEPSSKKQKVVQEASKLDEAYSSRAPSPPPSFFGASIQAQIQEALKPVVQQLLESNQFLMADIQNQVHAVIGGVDKNFKSLYQLQANYLQQIVDIRHRLDCLETLITGGSLSKAPVLAVPTYSSTPAPPPPPTQPSTSSIPEPDTSNVLFTMQQHGPSSPIHVSIDPPQQPLPATIHQSHHDSGSSESQEVPNPETDSPVLTPPPVTVVPRCGSPPSTPSFTPDQTISDHPPAPLLKLPSSASLPSLADDDKQGDKVPSSSTGAFTNE